MMMGQTNIGGALSRPVTGAKIPCSQQEGKDYNDDMRLMGLFHDCMLSDFDIPITLVGSLNYQITTRANSVIALAISSVSGLPPITHAD